MKHVSPLVAAAIGLAFAATSAWAGDDTARITQSSGSSNSATIEQIASGGGNYAVVSQGEGWYGGGGGNNAQLVQHGVEGSRIDVHQDGNMNDIRVYQFDGRNLEANVNVRSGWWGNWGGTSNTVLIEQSGFDSLAWVEQGDNASYNRAEIRQAGWGGQNVAEIMQSGGSNNQASIYQAGGSLNAGIYQGQGSYGNVAMIRQGY